MATLYGKNYELQYVDVPSQKIPRGEGWGEGSYQYEEYDLATLGVVIGAGDVILGPKLPQGARVVDAIFASPSMGATGIFDVGWQANGVDAADQDGLIAQADAGGQAVIAHANNVAGLMKQFSVETQIVITCTELTVNVAGVLKLGILFVVD